MSYLASVMVLTFLLTAVGCQNFAKAVLPIAATPATVVQSSEAERPLEHAQVQQERIITVQDGWTAIEYGTSHQGRPLVAEYYGQGEKLIIIVCNIHGNEGTILFCDEIKKGFTQNGIYPGFKIGIVRDANPDGTFASIRENANGVDLNRNWNFYWDRETQPNKGSSAFSEPETSSLARHLLNKKTDHFVELVIYYHSGTRLPEVYAANIGSVSELSSTRAMFYTNTVNSQGGRYDGYYNLGVNLFGMARKWTADNGMPSFTVELDMGNKNTDKTRHYNAIVHLMEALSK